MATKFLPLSPIEMPPDWQGQVDIVLITGDAYVDHPSFGVAVIGRVLEHHGFRVGIIAMPDWKNPSSITIFGKPRLCFGITSGNVDSMLSRYTAFKRYRSDDPYAPGGEAGHKPERAVIVYCNLVKSVYKDVPIVIGGIEASMRRVVHYDFWSDRVRRSILEDSRADILVYGMGEEAIVTIAERLADGASLIGIPGTVIMSREIPPGATILPSEEDAMASPESLLEFYRLFYRHQHRVLAQPAGKRYLIHYPPAELNSERLDGIYELPFVRRPHPSYEKSIPAFEMIRHSITAHRGCVSGCSFCSLTLHQGKKITSRGQESILREVKKIAAAPDFKGHITDIGGPSANNYAFGCRIQWRCPRESCTFPALCPNLQFGTTAWIELLEKASQIPGVKQVTVGSGIRYDLFMRDPAAKTLLKKLLAHHVSGQLKIAPEHTTPTVLRAMRKLPLIELNEFICTFRTVNESLGKRQHLLPYLMSCHPGTCLQDMKTMVREILSSFEFVPEQVQAFIPLPMTLASIIYYTKIDPLTGEKFYVARSSAERRQQHDVFFKRVTRTVKHRIDARRPVKRKK
ncbi:MAG: YgiQ family radical SAM protein [candidate division KSB1 bacterium]|nr:YgiQ family radical SAM protein [candidate division KSB1 bacterium]